MLRDREFLKLYSKMTINIIGECKLRAAEKATS